MIAVDIGNTNLHFFCFKGKKIVKKLQIPTVGVTAKAVKEVLNKFPAEPVIVCSVVPEINKFFRKLKRKVYLIGHDLTVPIICQYKRKEVGADRLVAAFAAKILFPGTRIVLDFGTAITLDFLSRQGIYQGGIILPGAGSTLRVFSGCALLPDEIKITKTKRLIPRNTRASISKGLTEGFSAMINGLVRRYQKLLAIPADGAVVITGGEAKWVKAKLDFPYHYEPWLVAKGLQILANQTNQSSRLGRIGF